MMLNINGIRRIRVMLVVVMGTLAFPVWANESKEVQELLEHAETIIAVSGTSTLHDWTVTTQTVKGTASLEPLLDPKVSWEKLEIPPDGTLPLAITVTIPVDSIVSGKDGMDKVMYKSLDQEKHPEITYQLREARPKTDPDAERTEKVLICQTTGQLTVAGTAYSLTTDMKFERLEGNRIRISGHAPMAMTDFAMKPPKALMGMVKAGNEVEVLFRWTLPDATE